MSTNPNSVCPNFDNGEEDCPSPVKCVGYDGYSSRYPADSIGYAQHGSLQQPHGVNMLYDDQGAKVPDTKHPSFRGPIMIHVESARRNTTLYPHPASFRMLFPQSIKGLISIELVDFAMKSPEVFPPDYYFFLSNGLMNLSTNKFTPQSNGVSLYDSLRPDGTNPTVHDFADSAFKRITFDPDFTIQTWERQAARHIYYFRPEKGQLTYLDFSLVDRTGALLDIASPELNWAATFFISARHY